MSRIIRGSQSAKITIKARDVLSDVKIGDSIAINGVCLTVVQFGPDHFTADVMAETLKKTNLNDLRGGDEVNLERALKPTDRLGGHLVQGHVDGIGTITVKEKVDIAILYTIKAPEEVIKYAVPKGSIAVDGISLTVVDVFHDAFTVSLIPHTRHITTLGLKKEGEKVNLESDIIGRYIERLLFFQKNKAGSGIDLNFLSEHGFD